MSKLDELVDIHILTVMNILKGAGWFTPEPKPKPLPWSIEAMNGVKDGHNR
jgi:hypothetical protein